MRAGVNDVVESWSPEDIAEDERVKQLVYDIWRAYQRDAESFNRCIQPIIDYAIRFYGPLPASHSDHHAYENGLIIHLLQVAYWTLRNHPGKIERGALMTGHKREQNEEVYFQILMLISFLHDVGKPITDYKVWLVEDPEGSIWVPTNEPLADFCERHNSWAIGWKWHKKRHNKHARHAPEMCGIWLRDIGIRLTHDMDPILSSAVRGDEDSFEANLVRTNDARSLKHDKFGQTAFQTSSDGGGLKVLAEAVAKLFSTGQWRFNSPGSPVWVTKHGVHLITNQAERDLLAEVARIPGQTEESHFATPEEVLRKLREAGVVASYKDKNGKDVLHEHIIPDNLTNKKNKLRAIRLTQPERLGIDIDGVEPVGLHLYSDADDNVIEQHGSQGDDSDGKHGGGKEHGAEILDESEDELTKIARQAITFLSRDAKYLDMIRDAGGQVLTPWPQGLEGMGKSAQDVLLALHKAGWAGDPVQGEDGQEVPLTGEAAEKIRTALSERESDKSASKATSQDVGPEEGEAPDEDEAPKIVLKYVEWLFREADQDGLSVVSEINEDEEGVFLVDDGDELIATRSIQYNFLNAQRGREFQTVTTVELTQALVDTGMGEERGGDLVLEENAAEELRKRLYQ